MHFRKYDLRFAIVFISFIILLLYFACKLILIQFFKSEHLASLAQKQHNHSIEIEPIRGTIYDRNLRPLALNVSAYSLYANPRMMSQEEKLGAVKQLSELLGLEKDLLEKLLNKQKYFVWIKRKLNIEEVEKIRAFKIRGLDFIKESKRYYPNRTLAAHIIGFSGVDNNGLDGIELKYDRYLKGQSGLAEIIRDAKQKDLLIEKSYLAPKDGFNIVLTIDETIQYIAEHAVDKAMDKFHAKAATVIVMDIRTGEILALVNRPTYDLSNVSSSNVGNRTNRAVSFIYEPGSVFKIVPAAAALEEGFFTETDEIFCENGEYRVANHILHDHHPLGKLTFTQVFEHSSNIGVTKIAQKMGPDMIYKYGQRFHFGKRTGVDLGGEVSGVFKDPKYWSKTSIGAIPIGHEVTTTPMQLITAIAAIANDGIMMKPFVVKYIKDNKDQDIVVHEPTIVDRVVSTTTALRLKSILKGVTENGTGKKARIDGVPTAGKTGTAQKVIDGQYSHSLFYATFFGFAPVENAQIAAIVVFDEPRPVYFGGSVSAPVFKEIVENSLKYLNSSN